nr:amino acid ABC transporter permease [Culicoidibacter larvae]
MDAILQQFVSWFGFLEKYWPMFLSGTLMTVFIALFGVLLGTILGLLLSVMKISKIKVLQALASVYVEFIRGTPLLVQVYIIYFGLPAIGIKLDPVLASIVAVSINSGAYVAEIIRGGINAVDTGQLEAGRTLGMSYYQALRYIVIPQAFKNILPALGNEFITIIKESSIVSVIGVADLMYNANTVRNQTYLPFTPLLFAALIYFVLTFGLSRLLKGLERKWAR